MNKLKLPCRLALVLLVLLFQACASKGPATTYFALYPMVAEDVTTPDSVPALPSIGIGPVKLPGYLEASGIVSRAGEQELTISGYNAWAENLDAALSRVVSGNLSMLLDHDDIWAFPWDTRHRPEWQCRLVFERFDGTRGGDVVLKVRWALYDTRVRELAASGLIETSVSSTNSSYQSYVASLNQLVSTLSEELAAALLKEAE